MVHEFRAGRRAPSANRHQRRAKAARSRSQVKKHWFIEVQQDPINQAANRFIARGCDRCGAPAVLGFSVFFVPNGADFLAVCGDCQIGQNLKPTITLNLDAMIDPWAEFDRDWFAAHPDRCLRLRKALPGEIPAAAIDLGTTVPSQLPGHYWATVTYQINLREKARFFRQVPHGTAINCLCDQEVAANFLFKGDPEVAEQSLDDVKARLRGLVRADALAPRMQFD
jgi:hypothetical protein